ncbi:MAG: hypothetical protein BGN92_13915 [Sphingobacteriales bacterium 41-5]|mgnify:CR=1 FL=1|nr:MAG: hypothetical protein ABS67_01760 [Niabella sp. SCN 42-15]OJU27405.1 MAG: hypothetical protein BGN92_13915 [Sphingobacteriales bacterium 41-5]
MKINNILPTAFAAVFFLSSCRTEPVIPPSAPPTATGSELQQIADSVYLFSREIYFWDEIRLRAYDYEIFKPRDSVKTGDAVATAKAVLEKVKSTSTNKMDKSFSYATAFDDEAGTSSVAQNINDYGFYFKAGYSNRRIYPDLTLNNPFFSGFYINYVYKNSDAGKKGVQRGWKILSINGTDMTKITQAAVSRLNNMFYYETLKNADIVFQRPNAQNDTTINVAITSFSPNSVLYREKITSSTGRNIGYLVYNFFGKYAETKAEIDEAIQYFKNQGVNEIVIDLRYNRGGYTQMQDYLANSFAPASANGNVMYKMHYNADLQAGNYTLMRSRHTYDKDYYSIARNTHNFSTINNFNTTKLYVIVGESTASASELFINSIQPYLNSNIILIGDNNTYGKPVGFFPIDLLKKVTFWTVSFETRNKNEGAVPYSGFGPNYKVYDGVDKPWGDKDEDCLKAVVNLIDGKPAVSATTETLPRNVTPLLIKQKEIFEHSNLLLR